MRHWVSGSVATSSCSSSSPQSLPEQQLYVLHPINVIGNNTNKLTNFGSTVAMRFTVAAAVLSVVASSSAMALTERQVGVSNNLVCVTMTLPLLGTQNLAFCSDGTCTTALILGANEIAGLPLGASLNIGVSVYLAKVLVKTRLTELSHRSAKQWHSRTLHW